MHILVAGDLLPKYFPDTGHLVSKPQVYPLKKVGSVYCTKVQSTNTLIEHTLLTYKFVVFESLSVQTS